jgi:hypothetical protein
VSSGARELGSIEPVPFGIKVSVNFCWSAMCMVQGRPSATAAAEATTDALGGSSAWLVEMRDLEYQARQKLFAEARKIHRS